MASPSRELLPAAGIPWLYFSFAHVCLALAFGALALTPDMPGAFFLHPRMAAVVHLVTLGWITSSIIGAFYFVAPLTMKMPLRPTGLDRIAFVLYAAGVSAAVAGFWNGDYTRMAEAAALLVVGTGYVAGRALAGLRRAIGGWPVKVHIVLAFVNLITATIFGIVIGLNRSYGWFSWPPLAAAYAHLHIAAVGWATMMFVGLAYRLIPMIVPTVMPKGPSIAASAVLLQSGLALLVFSLLGGSASVAAGTFLIVTGLVSFVMHVRLALRQRLPPPAALPRPDWATRQTHAALIWLLIAALFGVWLSIRRGVEPGVAVGWWYGIAGLVGFLSQVIAGMQGRLVPMYAWYGAFEAGGHTPPPIAAHALPSPALARLIFLTWTIGVPALAAGLAGQHARTIRMASSILLMGVVLNGVQLARTFARARTAA